MSEFPDLADPAELERAAARLQRHASELRRTANAVTSAVARMQWSGDAASDFHDTAHADADETRAQASDLEAMARALRKGAQDVRTEIARRRAAAKKARTPAPSPSRGTPFTA
ncbi:MAG TPA: hypothetical protein VGJ60_11365 [Chloroflexota bacterium]